MTFKSVSGILRPDYHHKEKGSAIINFNTLDVRGNATPYDIQYACEGLDGAKCHYSYFKDKPTVVIGLYDTKIQAKKTQEVNNLHEKTLHRHDFSKDKSENVPPYINPKFSSADKYFNAENTYFGKDITERYTNRSKDKKVFEDEDSLISPTHQSNNSLIAPTHQSNNSYINDKIAPTNIKQLSHKYEHQNYHTDNSASNNNFNIPTTNKLGNNYVPSNKVFARNSITEFDKNNNLLQNKISKEVESNYFKIDQEFVPNGVHISWEGSKGGYIDGISFLIVGDTEANLFPFS